MKLRNILILTIVSISIHLIFNTYTTLKSEYLFEVSILDYLIPTIIYKIFLISLLLFFIYLLMNQKKS